MPLPNYHNHHWKASSRRIHFLHLEIVLGWTCANRMKIMSSGPSLLFQWSNDDCSRAAIWLGFKRVSSTITNVIRTEKHSIIVIRVLSFLLWQILSNSTWCQHLPAVTSIIVKAAKAVSGIWSTVMESEWGTKRLLCHSLETSRYRHNLMTWPSGMW